MNIAQFHTLNEIYMPLSARAAALCRGLKQAGFEVCWGWYHNHSAFLEGEYRAEHFPIPVLDVEGGCRGGGFDVGLHLDEIFVEFQLPRQKAVTFDWSCLPAPFEVYGVDNYLHDFYREGMDPEGIAGRIEASGENQVGVSLTFPGETLDETILRAVSHCRMWKGEEHT